MQRIFSYVFRLIKKITYSWNIGKKKKQTKKNISFLQKAKC